MRKRITAFLVSYRLTLTLTVMVLGFILYSRFASDFSWFNKELRLPSGNLVVEVFGGVIFLIIGLVFQKSNDRKLEELHDELKTEQETRKYQAMIDFLK